MVSFLENSGLVFSIHMAYNSCFRVPDAFRENRGHSMDKRWCTHMYAIKTFKYIRKEEMFL